MDIELEGQVVRNVSSVPSNAGTIVARDGEEKERIREEGVSMLAIEIE